MPETKDRAFDLSLSQRNIWNVEQTHKGTSINNICTTIRIAGRLELAVLQRALNLVVERDESLRTRITLVQGEPMQYHAAFSPAQFPVFDFSLTRHDGAARWEAAVSHESMPLLDSPLYEFLIFRMGEGEGGVLLKTHHIITDGWSQVLLGNRIANAYLQLLKGQDPSLPPAPSYRAHVEAEQAYLASRAAARDARYWQEQLAREAVACTIKESRGAQVSPVGQRRTHALSAVLNHEIQAYCAQKRIAPFAVLYMALAVYLGRIGGAKRLSVGVPVFNRSTFEEKETSGMFVSTLPFLCDFDESWSFNAFNEHMMESWYDLLRHQRLPFSRIAAIHREARPEQPAPFHIVLSYQNSRMQRSADASVLFTGRWHYSGYQAEHLVIHLSSLAEENRFSIDYDYLAQLFSEQEVDELHGYLTRILHAALNEPDKPIWQLPLLELRERERVLFSFNETAAPLPDTDVYGLFAQAAAAYPARVALIAQGERMRYDALARRAERYAAYMHARAPEGGRVIALALPREAELVAAMLGAAQSGNAWVILPAALPEARKLEILADSGAALLITREGALAARAGVEAAAPEAVHAAGLPPCPRRQAAPDALCYIVYTSGSTGKPKGVRIGQRNLVNFALGMTDVFSRSGVLSLCSTGFDVFVMESVAALLNARTVVLAGDREQEDAGRLAGLIEQYAAGYIAITPSRLRAYLGNADFLRAVARVDAFVLGGEPLSGELVQQIKCHSNARVYNQYGPSETTVGVSLARVDGAPAITIGKPMRNCRLYVLDAHLQPLPVGVYGELYVGGLCVGLGYHNDPEATAESFYENPFEPGERLYRTGDIACWTHEGTLLLGGRRDNQLKLRGLRIEPDEIVNRLEAHPDVQAAAVKLIRDETREFLAAYYVAPSGLSEVELLSFVSAYLPGYMIPAYLKSMEALPRTANGKTDLRALPDPPAPGEGRAPGTAAGETLLRLFCRALQRDDLTVDSDYFLCGGDSLNATALLCEIEEAFGVRVSMAELYALRSVSRLEERLTGCAPKEAAPAAPGLSPAPKMETYPLSAAQQSLYVQSRMDPTGLAYNMPGAFRLPPEIELERLERAFIGLVAQEEAFRTAFVLENGQVRQRILPAVPFRLARIAAHDAAAAGEAFLKPFDLACAPLLRAAVFTGQAGERVLFVDMHHTIADGVSMPLILRRLDALYRGEALPALPVHYKDYAYWQQSGAAAAGEEQRAYWRARMAGAGEPLDLPTDFPRPRDMDFRGAAEEWALPPELSARCEDFCAQHKLTPYALFAGVFGVLLGRLAGSADVIVGTPVSGREDKAFWALVGPFLNTLPLRLAPRDTDTVEDYLAAVNRDVAQMLDHQGISLEEIIALCNLPRSAAGNPLYRVMFALRPVAEDAFLLDGRPLGCVQLETRAAKLDLFLEAAKTGEGYAFRLEYATALFRRETAALLGRCYCALLAECMQDAQRPLARLTGIAPADRLMLIERPNRMRAPYVDERIEDTIAFMARLAPDAPAVWYHGEVTTFAALLARAQQIAGRLQSAGAQPGDIVALCCGRTPDLLAGMLGILLAGCAYLPMLASFPAQRLSYMLETAGAARILCDEKSAAALPPGLPAACVRVPAAGEAAAFARPEGLKTQDVIHILFTSGSTGQPKGVVLRHASIANLLGALTPLLQPVEGGVLCATGMVFDTFITETLIALALGKCCVMADEEEMLLPYRMAEVLRRSGAAALQLTPSRMQMSLDSPEFVEALHGVTHILMAGEAVTGALLAQLQGACGSRIFNLYGPAEAAVYVACAELTHAAYPTIGRALQNCRLYVLDEALRPALPTARGELYIAGECLALGYAASPELTQAAFLPDPFLPGARMYKTGDIVRLLPDGALEYLGRRDHQVKLHGQRVELDEISGRILRAGLAQEAVAIARERQGGMELCAFVTAKNGEAADPARIRAALAQALPDYMLPSTITVLPEMPRTATGKVDRLALAALPPQEEARPAPPAQSPAPEPRAAALPQEEGMDALARRVHAIWREALGRETIDPGRSIFEQGGNSLAALTILTRYFGEGFPMSLAAFYENPTLAAQLSLLRASGGGEDRHAQQSARPAQTAPCATAPCAKDAVLVTGATGFLGAHLVRALYEQGAQRILCGVRGAQQRLWDALSYYFGAQWAQAARGRVQAVECDITKEELGLAGAALAREVALVVHAAADVRHYAPADALERVNTGGTRHALAFAQSAQARFAYISTVSVCGRRLCGEAGGAVFCEQDADIGQDWRENPYIRSKFLAEEAVRAAAAGGLNAQILRVGRLVGRETDGAFQRNPEANAFYWLIRGALALPALPAAALHMPVEMTAVDACAAAIVTLLGAPDAVYHVYNPNLLPLHRVLRALGHNARGVGDQAFSQALAQALPSLPPEAAAQIVSLWSGFQKAPATIYPTAEATVEALAQRGFFWNEPQPQVLLKGFPAGPGEGVEA